MPTESISLPELGTPMATFSLWYVGVGERVREGDRLAEVLIPGALVEVPAPHTGVIHSLHARPGDALQAYQSLGTLLVDSE